MYWCFFYDAMMLLMRTTLTLDDEVAVELKRLAYEQDKPFKRVVNETLRAGLGAGQAPSPARRYRIKPAKMGVPRAGVDLTRALRLADGFEDAVIAEEIEARK